MIILWDSDFLYKGAAVSKGSLVPVVGIEYRENQVPRLITQNGYLTANKVMHKKLCQTSKIIYMIIQSM